MSLPLAVGEYQWVIPIIGLVMTGLYYYFRVKAAKGRKPSTPPPHAAAPVNNNIVINQNNNGSSFSALPQSSDRTIPSVSKFKPGVSILFVDDDIKFKVVSILKKDGWTNTRIIKDVNSLEQGEVAGADIFFIDIQGVGKALQFKDEGLGLVVALKKKYPHKKVVIYSAETGLNAFHQAFKVADDQISKDADPYEFVEAVERLSA